MPARIPIISISKFYELIRGTESGDRLSEVIAPFAFLLLLRWAEEQQGKEETIALFEGKDFVPQIPEEFSWSQISKIYLSDFETQNSQKYFFRHLVSSLRNLGDHGSAKILAQAARTFEVEKLTFSPRLLTESCRLISEFSFETQEDYQQVAGSFQLLIDSTIKITLFGGEYYSPPNITDLMLEIAEPKPGEKVYDPCFGTGNFLAEAGKRMLERADSPAAWEKVRTKGIYGIELNPTAYLIGLTRTILSGVSQPNLVWGNALERNGFEAQIKFDVILAAPPIGNKPDRNRWLRRFYPIHANSIENFFVQHIANHLAPNGRAIIAIPEGFLFRRGADEKLRKKLLTEFEVEGVISLPSGSLAPFTMVKPNLIIFRRKEPTDYVWFQQINDTRPIGEKKGEFVIFEPKAIGKRFKDYYNLFKTKNEVSEAFEILLKNELWKVPVSDLAKKQYDLSVKQPKSNKLDDYLQKILEKFPQTEIVQLGSIAEVISGISYTRSNTSDSPSQTNVPLIRVTELSKTGEIKTPVRFASEDLLFRSEKKRLQTGDIIVSTQGTIGKVGRVAETIDGAIPAHGITAIRLIGKKINFVNYLVNLLQSLEYQTWLNSEATGSVIMNLSVTRLQELPIPVLSEELQSKISSEYWVTGEVIDILEFINKPTDPGDLLLVNKFIQRLVEEDLDDSQIREQTFRLAQILEDLELELNSESGDLYYGFSELKNIAHKFSSSFFMPQNASRFGFLQITANDIEKYKANDFFQPRLDGQKIRRRIPPTFQLLNQLSEILKKAVDKQCHDLLYENGKFELKVEPSVVLADKETEFTVSLSNQTILPLRDVRFEMEDGSVLATKAILEANVTTKFQLQGPAEEEGNHSFVILWGGLQFDDEMAGGSFEHYFTALKQESSLNITDFGTNPYVVGSPLLPDKNQKMFFGREDIISEIKQHLSNKGQSTVILLEGNRRAGKTSIVNRLRLPEILPDWIPVYLTTQQLTSVETKDIFYGLTRELIITLYNRGLIFDVVGIGNIPAGLSDLKLGMFLSENLYKVFNDVNSFELLNTQIEESKKVIGDLRLLLILDEFDKIQQGIKEGKTSSVVPENIRALFHKHEHISGVLIGSKRIRKLREDYWNALFGIGIPIQVDALDAVSARRLITEPVENRLFYSDKVRESLIELTKCQPFLIQSLCSTIFKECAKDIEGNVSSKIFDVATEKMTNNNEHFKTLFEYIRNNRSRYIVCLIEKLSRPSDEAIFTSISDRLLVYAQQYKISFNLISESLLKEGINHTSKELDEDLKGLRELDVLEFENNSYRIKLPIFAEWLKKNEDYNAIHRRAVEE